MFSPDFTQDLTVMDLDGEFEDDLFSFNIDNDILRFGAGYVQMNIRKNDKDHYLRLTHAVNKSHHYQVSVLCYDLVVARIDFERKNFNFIKEFLVINDFYFDYEHFTLEGRF